MKASIKLFPDWGNERPKMAGSPNWNAKSSANLEIDFLGRALQRVEEARMLQALNQTASSIGQSTKKQSGKRT